MLQQKTYLAKQQGPHMFETKGPNAPKWYVVDAKEQVVGRLATIIARVIKGKHKTSFTKHADAGDFVIVINADKLVFTRNKLDNKRYYSHSGFVGGLKVITARDMMERDPAEVLRRAVWGMLPKSALSDRQMKKLKIFTGDKHPHEAQGPQPLPAGVLRRTSLSEKAKKLDKKA